MVSIYFVLGLYYIVGSLVYGLYRHGGGVELGRWNVRLLYGCSRLVPIFMMMEHGVPVWVKLAMDAALFLLVDRLTKGEEGKYAGRGSVLYCLNPVVILAVLSGKVWVMGLMGLLVLALLSGSCWVEGKKPGFSPIECYLPYVFLTYCVFFGWIGVEYYGQRLEWLLWETEKSPSVLLMAAVGVGLSLVLLLEKVLRWPEVRRWFSGEGRMLRREEDPVPDIGLTRWDVLLMVVLTAVFAAVVYWKLGSFAVPQSGYTMQRGENRELILDLGEVKRVESLDIYLGHQNKRKLSFSYLEPGGKEWTLLRSKYELNNPYVWHSVDMGVTTRYLGIVSMEESSQLLELVILGENGTRLLPVNGEEYGPLFDEQELYPEHQTYYDRMIFDELHHGRTAYDYLYRTTFSEATHPPLGKVLIGLGIRLFGMTPFGWRCVCALFGSLMVPLMYLFAWRLTRKTGAACTAAVLLCTEFMNFALSRISTLDIIIGFFILLMFYLMFCFVDGLLRAYSLKRRCEMLVLCGCATGCAIAVKWTGFYAVAGIAVIFFAFLLPHCNRGGWSKAIGRELVILFGVCVVSFLVVPAVIYVLSYLPYLKRYPEKSLLQCAVDNSVFMLTYHVDAVFAHPYSSEWYTWLVNKRPLLDALNKTGEGMVSSISTFGNPLVVWGGLVSLVHHVYLWMCRGNQRAKFLTIAYLSLLMPWWFIHRTVFIYQYFGCILILILMLTHSAAQTGVHQGRVFVVLAGVSCGLFVMFYPVLSGMEISTLYINEVLEWMDSWTFG